MPRTSVAKLGLLFTAIVAGGFGCELIAQVDRSQIGGSGGSGGSGGAQSTATTTTTVGSTSSTSSAGGTGGSGGTGGAATTGTGGGMPCGTAADCPDPGNECLDRTCTQGTCGTAPKAAGTLTTAQTTGDCLKSQCDGTGKIASVNDDTDLPVDGLECTDDVCTAGVASNPPKAASTACGQNGDLFCDGAGKCVGCNAPADCAGADTECQTRTCTAGACGVSNAAQGTVVAAQTAGNCHKDQCDGNGAIESVVDDTDLPADGETCTKDVCTAGVPSNPPEPVNTACSEGTGILCDGAGKCAACVVATDCAGTDTECQQRTCTAGVCGVSNTAAGTALAAQTASDCKKVVCDGNGATTTQNDDTDLPDDNNACTTDVCTAGAPSHGSVANGASCGGSLTCLNGTCTGCGQPSDCPGVDDECKTRTCTVGVCGFNFTASGFVVAAQTAGDCQKKQCDGAGNIAGVADNTDVPADDGIQCTSEVCTAGVPSHPAVAANTACTQNGGSFCSAAGTCVECNAATQCSGTDTECHTRTCNGNVCGANNAAAGTATAAQTAGDCHKNQCDGSGNIVNNVDNSDVPADEGNQCTSETCAAGVPSHPAVAVNTACSQNGGSFCSAGGTCVQCNAATQCSGTDTECHTRTCNGNVCGANNAAAGTATAAQTANDCQKNQCDGAGNIVTVTDATDVPVDDGNQCTGETCVGTTPSHPNLAQGTACNQSGGTFCNGAGTCIAASCSDGIKNGSETAIDCGGGACPACAIGLTCGGNADCLSGACAGGVCVECLTAAQCPGTDTECHTRTCNGNVCGASNAASGTATSAQTAGDCHTNQCDGAGNIVNNVDDADLPADDGNQCTSEVCTAGVPSHAAVAVDTACSQNGGAFCSAAGTCVQCNAATQCSGTDTECHTRTCNGNVCGSNNAASGTATSAQTAGDCHTNQCDGAGNIVNNVDDADLPADDGNQCTSEVCTAGVASHPLVPADTACTQNGGAVCSVGGTCVQCNSPTQCPGTDTECHTRLCVANSCTANNPTSGTVTSAQTAGDCHSNQCDGAGNIVNNVDNADVPNDGAECTSDVCTAGAPSNPPLPLNTSCSQNGGTVCDGGGSCVSAPQVASTSPSDATTPVAGPAIAVTFTAAMNPATLTGQTTAGACSGSIQVSLDGFASCVAFSSASAVMSGGNTTASFTAAPGLLVNRNYKIRVTTAAASATGIPLAAQFAQPSGFTTVSPNLGDGSVVISQLFGGGGASATSPNADYVELHNRGTTPVTMTNWSLQYAGAGGSSWSVVSFSGTIQPGAYFLVRTQNTQATGTALPAPDATGTAINMSATAGKIALVSNTTPLSVACPTGGAIVDFVGFGTQTLATGCWEGPTTVVSTAAAPSSTTADYRVQSGCGDVNNNTSDFATAAPLPRNSATAAAACAAYVHNETSAGFVEADYVTVQFPVSLSQQTGTTATVYGRIYEAGVTDQAATANANVRAQLGYGPATANPQYEAGWTWTNATFNAAFSDPSNDEYQATFTTPAVGTYRYVYRFSLDQGVSWTVADQNAGDGGAGANVGLVFEFSNESVMSVTP